MNTKNRILLEAVENYDRRLSKIEMVLKEALTHPVFRFENEFEYQLFESFGRAPRLGSVALGGGGSGRFGEYTKTLGRFRELVKGTPDISKSTSPRDFVSSLEDMFDILDLVVGILNKEDASESAKKEARILIYELNSFLIRNAQLVVDLKRELMPLMKIVALGNNILEKQQEFKKLIPSDFSYLAVKPDIEQSEKAGKESEEYERKLKRGFFGGLADKLSGIFGR
jgi:hypothetical protein